MDNKLVSLKNICLSPLFVGIIFFLSLQLQLFNLDIGFRDEGYLLNNAQRINNGEMPYVDFFLAITPGTYYIQAFVMKIFGNYIITDRILYILCVILILILSSRLFKFTSYLNYIFLISLGIIYAGKLSFASYNIEALVFIIISLLLFNKLISNDREHKYSFLIGLMNSIVFIFKQSYGGVFFLTLLILITFFTKRRYLAKNIFLYLLGGLIVPAIFSLFFYLNGSLYKLVNAIFYSALSVKNDRLPFILTSLLFIAFFAFVFNFAKKFSLKRIILSVCLFLLFLALYILISPGRMHYIYGFYKDTSVYYFLIFLTAPIILINLFFKSNSKQERYLVIISIEALGLFLASAFSGRDYATVVVTAPLYIPLFFYALVIICKKFRLPTNNILITLLLALFIFPSISYLAKTYGKLYGIGYDKEIYVNLNIKQAKYINIPISQKNDLEPLIDYVKKVSLNNGKLLCFPYCPLLNFLTDRDNASYFNFFYKFRPGDQNKVIVDIGNNKNIIILIQKMGEIEKEANYEDEKLSVLKTFIQTNYKPTKTTQNFYIYKN
ncbi:MAG: hypothetical protein Q7R31_03255 [Candidatus Levybacteria bacterium]|nr:hypothetical protein [Candidatus Levybacteria bacterium]